MTYQVMTKTNWLTKVHENQEALRDFIGNWHPSARRPYAIQRKSVLLTNGDAVAMDVPSMEITAPAAERACAEIRQDIRKKEPVDPLVRWDAAIVKEDIGELICLMEGAWFGVPESQSCWSIRGFSEAVDLMDDPPEMEGA